jgi:hypothetical protein
MRSAADGVGTSQCSDPPCWDRGGGGFTSRPALSWTWSPPWLEDPSGSCCACGARAHGPGSVAPAMAWRWRRRSLQDPGMAKTKTRLKPPYLARQMSESVSLSLVSKVQVRTLGGYSNVSTSSLR